MIDPIYNGDRIVIAICNFLLRHFASEEYHRRLDAVIRRGLDLGRGA